MKVDGRERHSSCEAVSGIADAACSAGPFSLGVFHTQTKVFACATTIGITGERLLITLTDGRPPITHTQHLERRSNMSISEYSRFTARWVGITIGVAAGIALLIVIAMWILPQYNVWSRELGGKAELREAEWSRKIAVEEARAKMESAKLLAAAEVERAKGVAEANEIIGVSLQGNEVYLRYLWIQGLHDGSSEIIYVPTETQLPLLEAGRLTARKEE